MGQSIRKVLNWWIFVYSVEVFRTIIDITVLSVITVFVNQYILIV